MPDDVPHDTKLKRLNTIIELQHKITYDEKSRRLGSIEEAVIEESQKKIVMKFLPEPKRIAWLYTPDRLQI